MASLSDYARPTARILAAGRPGSGKTGSLAALANAGYKLRIIDLEGNLEPLIRFTDPEARDRVEVVYLEDSRGLTDYGYTPTQPRVVDAVEKLLRHWKYADVDLGRPADWGPDTVLVLDSLTPLCEAAMDRVLFQQGRNPLTRQHRDWGMAMQLIDGMLARLKSRKLVGCHVVVMCHIKVIGPNLEVPDPETAPPALVTAAAEAAARISAMTPPRLYPAVLGRELAPYVARHFSTVVLYETDKKGRFIHTAPRPDFDVKVPVQGLPERLPVEDGLLRIVRAIEEGGV